MPGVPDFYQGTEFWDLSLVDPDNRRPVDFDGARVDCWRRDRRDAGLARARGERWPDGRIKLALTRRLLALRQQLPHVFTHGGYRPLESKGAARERDRGLRARERPGRRHRRAAADCSAAPPTTGGDGRRATRGTQRWRSKDFPTSATCSRPARPCADPSSPVSELFDALPVALLRAQYVPSQARATGEIGSSRMPTARGAGARVIVLAAT